MHRKITHSRPGWLRLPALALVLGAMALLAACGGGTSAPSSTALLTTAAAKLGTDTAFHFAMSEANPGTPTGTQTDIRSATGDAVKPDRLSAAATVAIGSFSGDTNVVVVGNHAWYKDPFTGQFESADQYANIGGFFNDLNNGLAGAIKNGLQDVSAPTDSSVTIGTDSVPCWKINAKVSSDYLSSLTGGQVQGGQEIPVTLCIGKDDGQLRQVLIPGKLTDYDTAQTTRQVLLSNFNENVTITPPPGS